MTRTAADALGVFQEHYRDRLKAARDWAAKGGKVVGYLCDNIPEELIIAAGFLPLRVSGDPASGTDLVRAKVDRLFAPEVVNRPPFAASILERLLDGTYAGLDYLIIPHNRNAIQAMFRELHDAKAQDPSLRTPPVTAYFDKAWAPNYAAEVYNRDRVIELKAVIEGWAGKPIADAALKEAIALCNESRRLLSQVAALRAADAPKLSGVEALAIIGSAMLMPKAEHNALLKDFLAGADALTPRKGPKLFLGGSPLDHPGVYEVIEASGATVVAEDHCWGNRSFDLPVETDLDPMLALASRFHVKPACSISFPLASHVGACARRVAAAKVDGAIFYVMDQDWTQVWETPSEAKRLRADGVPVLSLLAQGYTANDDLAGQVAAFVATLPAKSATDRVSA